MTNRIANTPTGEQSQRAPAARAGGMSMQPVAAPGSGEGAAVSPPPRERPILFSGEMVRAILAGRKTQTRRVVASALQAAGGAREIEPGYWQFRSYAGEAWAPSDEHPEAWVSGVPCPYGASDDRLWVRETWACLDPSKRTPVLYRADEYPMRDYRWRPSIYMPRWASRLSLDITAVRVERLQDISEEDARAEGVEQADSHRGYPSARAAMVRTYRAGFEAIWNRINAARGFGWDTNPWVWVLGVGVAEQKRSAA